MPQRRDRSNRRIASFDETVELTDHPTPESKKSPSSYLPDVLAEEVIRLNHEGAPTKDSALPGYLPGAQPLPTNPRG